MCVFVCGCSVMGGGRGGEGGNHLVSSYLDLRPAISGSTVNAFGNDEMKGFSLIHKPQRTREKWRERKRGGGGEGANYRMKSERNEEMGCRAQMTEIPRECHRIPVLQTFAKVTLSIRTLLQGRAWGRQRSRHWNPKSLILLQRVRLYIYTTTSNKYHTHLMLLKHINVFITDLLIYKNVL